jgi:TusA-related sulfurtransferase
VKSSQALKELPVGDVLKVVTSPRGSISIHMLAQTLPNVETVERDTLQDDGIELKVHYLRRTE